VISFLYFTLALNTTKIYFSAPPEEAPLEALISRGEDNTVACRAVAKEQFCGHVLSPATREHAIMEEMYQVLLQQTMYYLRQIQTAGELIKRRK
jgi:hypothetical protein